MPDSAPGAAPSRLVWRIPPWQPALLFLIASVCAAANLYAHPSAVVRAVTILVGLAAVGMAVAALRMYLVVDDDGIGVRRLLGESSVAWAEVENVMAIERGFDTMTLRIMRRDGTFVDVPQSLVLPTKPTSKPRVRARMGDIARQVMAYGEPYRR